MKTTHPVEFLTLLDYIVEALAPDGDSSSPALLSAEHLNWEYLLDMAEWHGVLPLAANGLSGHPSATAEVCQAMHDGLLAIASWNLRLASELASISADLESRGVRHIPYKGIVLSELLYGTITHRSIRDIDLVVQQRDIPAAIKCLEELGFSDGYGLNPGQRSAAIRYGFEHSFVRDGVVVDLHWRLAQHFVWPSLDMDRLWRSLIPFTLYGRDYWILSPEATLAALCSHAAVHDWRYLSMFVDIAALLLRYPSLNWSVVESLSGDSHSTRSILVSLQLAHDYLKASLPPAVQIAVHRDGQVKLIADVVSSQQWPWPTNPVRESTSVRWLLTRTKGENLFERWKYLAGIALWPTVDDFRNLGLPCALMPLYFALRPLRILGARLGKIPSASAPDCDFEHRNIQR